ncbi:class I adenylate-forming enzyme family protein, partial [Bradyrhizobium sp.]|uniref:AMP-binding protein n=1 Tax=Bradyrhizobium sp. TaxID=376 RepID=UPI00260D0682
MVLGDRVVTYGMLARVLRGIEMRLAPAGLAKGDLVGVRVGNPTRHLAMLIALQNSGLVSVPLGHDESLTATLPLKAIASEQLEPPRPGVKQFMVTDDWFAGAAEMPTPRPSVFAATDDCCIMMSSGTTGRPKPIWLSPAVIEEWIAQLSMSMAGGNFEIVMCCMSVAGAWGYAVALTALWGGKTLLLSDVARETLHMISLYRAEYLVCSGHQLRMLIECQNEHFVPCSTLRQIEIGGSLLMPELVAAARAKLGGRIISEYGTSEIGQIARSPEDRLPAIEGAVGYVMPWATVETLDGTGRVLPQGQEGILRLRSTAQGRWE